MNVEPQGMPPAIQASGDPAAAFLALLRPLWEERWLILGAAIAGLFLAILALHLMTPRYTAYLQLVPTEQGSGVQVNRNISGLASLAGLNLPRSQGSQFAFALESMKGRDVAEGLARQEQLMQRLFAASYDPATNRWVEPQDRLRGVKNSIKKLLAMPVSPWSPPGPIEVQRYLQKNLGIAEDQKRAIATLTLSHPDPVLARDLLEATYRTADNHLRDRMETRTSAYIDYLAEKLQVVTLAEHRAALSSALAEQERMLMVARSGQPFAADPLGIVSATDRPVSPNALLTLSIGLGAGTGIGIVLALARRWLQASRSRISA